MTIREFLEKAIEGGWKLRGSKVSVIKRGKELRWQHSDFTEAINESEVFLDPKAWKAVGKVKGWSESYDMTGPIYLKVGQKWDNHSDADQDPEYYQKMYLMIGFLLAGKTLEEYIATL